MVTLKLTNLQAEVLDAVLENAVRRLTGNPRAEVANLRRLLAAAPQHNGDFNEVVAAQRVLCGTRVGAQVCIRDAGHNGAHRCHLAGA